MKNIIKLLFLTSSLLFTSTILGQKPKEYVKFVTPLVKKIDATNIGSKEILVEFKTKKEATVYIELLRRGKLVGGNNYTSKPKKGEIIKFKLIKYVKGPVIAAMDYTLKIYCFEGPKNNFNSKIGKTHILEDISLTRFK